MILHCCGRLILSFGDSDFGHNTHQWNEVFRKKPSVIRNLQSSVLRLHPVLIYSFWVTMDCLVWALNWKDATYKEGLNTVIFSLETNWLKWFILVNFSRHSQMQLKEARSKHNLAKGQYLTVHVHQHTADPVWKPKKREKIPGGKGQQSQYSALGANCSHHSTETGWILQPKFGGDVETNDSYLQRAWKKFITHIISFSGESRIKSQAGSW